MAQLSNLATKHQTFAYFLHYSYKKYTQILYVREFTYSLSFL